MLAVMVLLHWLQCCLINRRAGAGSGATRPAIWSPLVGFLLNDIAGARRTEQRRDGRKGCFRLSLAPDAQTAMPPHVINEFVPSGRGLGRLAVCHLIRLSLVIVRCCSPLARYHPRSDSADSFRCLAIGTSFSVARRLRRAQRGEFFERRCPISSRHRYFLRNESRDAHRRSMLRFVPRRAAIL
jgi:hypothetical protein